MARSLRARLLLSYGLVVAALLVLFSLGLGLSLLRNPLIYESATHQLRSAQLALGSRADLLALITPNNAAAAVKRIEKTTGVRALLVQPDGTQLADSQPALAKLVTNRARLRVLESGDIGLLRDAHKQVWLALAVPVDDRITILLTVHRPRVALLQFFTNEFVRPVLVTGLVGLALSVLIALLMAQWISAPLKRIGAAADGMAAGRFQPIQPEGPAEVRSLALSFNHMMQRVLDAQQSQRELVANVSHELKTPLTSIRGFTQAILDGVARTPAEVQQAAQVISSEAGRMQRLVQDLVTLARLEAGTAGLQRAPVDIASLVRAAAEKFRPQVNGAGLSLAVDAPGEDHPLLVPGDEDRLAQVLSNLIDNAIKFTPSGGALVVSVQAVGRSTRIQVADTGTGIPAEDREKIFDRFYQADRSRAGQGMGLGLAITRQIVLAHGGSIRVTENPPHGSVFTVDLPMLM
jgi:signal transduction histidine kinase